LGVLIFLQRGISNRHDSALFPRSLKGLRDAAYWNCWERETVLRVLHSCSVTEKFALKRLTRLPTMTEDEQELLEKQLRGVAVAPRDNGVMMLAITAVFFAGMAFGGFLFAYNGQAALHLASNDARAALNSAQDLPPPTVR
jgi:hypothetical protein